MLSNLFVGFVPTDIFHLISLINVSRAHFLFFSKITFNILLLENEWINFGNIPYAFQNIWGLSHGGEVLGTIFISKMSPLNNKNWRVPRNLHSFFSVLQGGPVFVGTLCRYSGFNPKNKKLGLYFLAIYFFVQYFSKFNVAKSHGFLEIYNLLIQKST